MWVGLPPLTPVLCTEPSSFSFQVFTAPQAPVLRPPLCVLRPDPDPAAAANRPSLKMPCVRRQPRPQSRPRSQPTHSSDHSTQTSNYGPSPHSRRRLTRPFMRLFGRHSQQPPVQSASEFPQPSSPPPRPSRPSILRPTLNRAKTFFGSINCFKQTPEEATLNVHSDHPEPEQQLQTDQHQQISSLAEIECVAEALTPAHDPTLRKVTNSPCVETTSSSGPSSSAAETLSEPTEDESVEKQNSSQSTAPSARSENEQSDEIQKEFPSCSQSHVNRSDNRQLQTKLIGESAPADNTNSNSENVQQTVPTALSHPKTPDPAEQGRLAGTRCLKDEQRSGGGPLNVRMVPMYSGCSSPNQPVGERSAEINPRQTPPFLRSARSSRRRATIKVESSASPEDAGHVLFGVLRKTFRCDVQVCRQSGVVFRKQRAEVMLGQEDGEENHETLIVCFKVKEPKGISYASSVLVAYPSKKNGKLKPSELSGFHRFVAEVEREFRKQLHDTSLQPMLLSWTASSNNRPQIESLRLPIREYFLQSVVEVPLKVPYREFKLGWPCFGHFLKPPIFFYDY